MRLLSSVIRPNVLTLFTFYVGILHYQLIYYLIFLQFTLGSSSTRESSVRRQIALEENFKQGNYGAVLQLHDSLQISKALLSPALLLTVAHAAHKLDDTVTAYPIYRQLATLELPVISPVAANQLGVASFKNKRYLEALGYFKQAITLAPGHRAASYNYELTYKKFPPRSNSNKQENEQIQENFEQQVTETQQDEEKKDLLAKSIPPRMERERALQLLDAMRTNELQGMSLRKLGSSRKKSEKNW